MKALAITLGVIDLVLLLMIFGVLPAHPFGGADAPDPKRAQAQVNAQSIRVSPATP